MGFWALLGLPDEDRTLPPFAFTPRARGALRGVNRGGRRGRAGVGTPAG